MTPTEQLRRLYALASAMETAAENEKTREAAREIALLALDLLAGVRAGEVEIVAQQAAE